MRVPDALVQLVAVGRQCSCFIPSLQRQLGLGRGNMSVCKLLCVNVNGHVTASVECRACVYALLSLFTTILYTYLALLHISRWESEQSERYYNSKERYTIVIYPPMFPTTVPPTVLIDSSGPDWSPKSRQNLVLMLFSEVTRAWGEQRNTTMRNQRRMFERIRLSESDSLTLYHSRHLSSLSRCHHRWFLDVANV
jgi:hypothetical protein